MSFGNWLPCITLYFATLWNVDHGKHFNLGALTSLVIRSQQNWTVLMED